MTNVLVSSFADKPVALSTEPVVTGDEPVLSQTVATSPTPQTLDRHSRLREMAIMLSVFKLDELKQAINKQRAFILGRSSYQVL